MRTRHTSTALQSAFSVAPPPSHAEGRGLKVASLFSGCGGLDLGLVQAGHEARLRGPRSRDLTAAQHRLTLCPARR